MRVIRSYCYGADQWADLAEALLNVSASIEAFESRLLLMFPATEIHNGHAHRRYTIYSSPVQTAKAKLASIYVEL